MKPNSTLGPRGRVIPSAKFFFRGGQKFFLKGVTYGPFQPSSPGVHLHGPEKTAQDLELIRQMGANVLRLYHVPPRWFLDLCEQFDLQALITIPWEQHINFLDSRVTRLEIQDKISSGVSANRGHPAIFGYMVGNEIPTGTIRWYGLPRVKAFVENLLELAKEADPKALVTYANFPSTEYLIPNNVDFYCYNVYLEKQEVFERYLARLHNIAEDKPLILGEFGMDSIRNSQEKQAETLDWHIRTVGKMGLAGTIVFAWTDDWFTGNHQITDWAFGLVDAQRQPKKAYHAVQECFIRGADGRAGQRVPLAHYPRVSIVVCSYNGARTLQACMQSLQEIDYPDFEIILVDDGSKDDTQSILRDFPNVKNIRQKNMGLSYARNVGWQAASGAIVAYTDSDCMADKDWLYYLVATLQNGSYAGVGGPNISPPAQDWIQACVAAAPGSPSHVLLTDTVAEHIPGCNMAFWRWAFDVTQGWDVEYRKAGDDVDFCWRLQQAGYEIAFSPSAIVWHHRRFSINAFFKQQQGYGEAESLLRFKHLIFFNPNGTAKWKGSVYGLPRFERFLQQPIIYHGVFGMGLFQSIYPAPESAFAGISSSLEWVTLTACAAVASLVFPAFWIIPVFMFLATVFTGFTFMVRARLEPRYDTLLARLLVWWLAIVQPLMRGWSRYFTWISLKHTPSRLIVTHEAGIPRFRFERENTLSYWSNEGIERDRFLSEVTAILEHENWQYSLDTGWTDWDIQVYGNTWWDCRLRSMTENHGGNDRLNRIQLAPKMTSLTKASLGLLVALIIVLHVYLNADPYLLVVLSMILGTFLLFWAVRLRNRLGEICELAARRCRFVRVEAEKG
ncbi:MAG: glycosyltransferase [Verrucomicrobiae bacterium]|nr:glycosyltransferase [Verrucomicrobiae bacterium]